VYRYAEEAQKEADAAKKKAIAAASARAMAAAEERAEVGLCTSATQWTHSLNAPAWLQPLKL
jgi:hypothetical protein